MVGNRNQSSCLADAVRSGDPKSMSMKKRSMPCLETIAALIGTSFSALLLILTALHAGPLWRDEVNTFNLAQMPLGEMWNHLPFESFPPLWPLLLRGATLLGLVNDDFGVRMLGLCVGLCFLASLWLCSRWMGARGPILSIALLGFLPSFLFILGANRAYGLGCCLLALSFGMIWRLLELPSKSRIVLTGLICVVFVQCLYYDCVLLCAMLAGAALVTIRRRDWKTLCALTGIGAISGAPILIYLPVVHRGSAYLPLIRDPYFDVSAVWYGFCNALAARSSGDATGPIGLQFWLWFELLMVGLAAGVAILRTRSHPMPVPERDAPGTSIRPDSALFSVVSMIVGIGGSFLFLARLQFFMQPWYYAGLITLCALSLDSILGANWPALRFGGWLRIGFMTAMVFLGAMPAWREAHTRRSNVDLAAAYLARNASTNDLILVEDAWEGITFARYYHGQTGWMTVPPINSHQVHRNDLVADFMSRPNGMAPLLGKITRTLQRGDSVWLVGNTAALRPKASPPQPPTGQWLGSYLDWWNWQVNTLLWSQSLKEQAEKIPALQPVSTFEDVSVARFRGLRPGAEASAPYHAGN